MNIAFFLTPKKDIVYGFISSDMREILDKLEQSRYTAIPLLDKEGKYVGVISEGDLLAEFKKNPKLTLNETHNISISDIERRTDCAPVSIEARIEDLITLSKNQNFVPVVDDEGVLIGIIKRSDIINYFWESRVKSKESGLSY